MIPNDSNDELRQRLIALSSDLDRVSLPGPGAARKRAARRTRNQITTGVAASVAVVAVGGAGLFQVADPPNGSSPDDLVATEPSQGPTIRSHESTVTTTPDDASPTTPTLLTEDQIGTIGTAGEFTVSTPEDLAETVTLHQYNACVQTEPDTGPEGSAQAWRGAWTNGLDAQVTETILRFESTREAAAFLDAHASLEQPCMNGDPQINVVNPPPEHHPEESARTWSVSYVPTPEHPGTSTSFFAVGIAMRDETVVILTYGAMDDPLGDGQWSEYLVDRLGTALDAAIGD